MSAQLPPSDPEFYSTILSQILTGYQLTAFHQQYARKCHSQKDLLRDDLSECRQVPKSLRNLLDVISCVIISNTKQGRAAVAVSTTEHGIAIYISHPSSSRSPAQVENYVRSLVTTVKEIAHLDPECDGKPRADLAQKMYEWSWQKFEHSFNKRKKEFDRVSAAIENGSDDIWEFFGANDLDDLEMIFNDIRLLGRMMFRERIQELATLIAECHTRWTANRFLELQLAVYAGTNEAKRFNAGFGRMNLFERVEQYASDRLKIYFPVTRWVTKWMSLHAYKSFLIRFAQTKRLRLFIDATYQVNVIPYAVPRQMKPKPKLDKQTLKKIVQDVLFHLEYETNTDLGWINLEDPEYMDSFISWTQHKQKKSATRCNGQSSHIHAELALFSYARYHELNITPYFGISKLPCTLCRMVFQVHNTLTPSQSVHCRSANVALYEGSVWMLPSEMDETTLDDLRRRLQAMLVGVFLEYVNQKVGNLEGLWNLWGREAYLLDENH